MKITSIKTTPLLVPYSKPYYWAQGVIEGACVVLVEVHTDSGIIGYGESIGTPSASAVEAYLKQAAKLCIGRSPFSNARLMADAYHSLFQVRMNTGRRTMHPGCKLLAFDVEVIEQPTHCESVAALAQVRARSPISISADQSVFTPFDAYDVCRQQAADLIVIGLHETGGLLRLSKIAHIAEAAGINICLHGLYETGITTCAGNQIAATIPNLDDANQHMTRFLAWDIVKSPDLKPRNGRLPVLGGPGLGFELDWNGVERAKRAFADLEATSN